MAPPPTPSHTDSDSIRRPSCIPPSAARGAPVQGQKGHCWPLPMETVAMLLPLLVKGLSPPNSILSLGKGLSLVEQSFFSPAFPINGPSYHQRICLFYGRFLTKHRLAYSRQFHRILLLPLGSCLFQKAGLRTGSGERALPQCGPLHQTTLLPASLLPWPWGGMPEAAPSQTHPGPRYLPD